MKKNILLLFAAILAGYIAHAQKIDAGKVPSAVVSAFSTKFPKAEQVTWEQESSNTYEATYRLNGKKVSVNLDKNGKWQETETEIGVDELPAPVAAAIRKEFSGYNIREASKIESEKHGNCFEAELEKEGETIDVLFTADGKVLGKSKMEDKEDKD